MAIVLDTDRIKLTRDLRDRLARSTRLDGECVVFDPESDIKVRHIRAEIYGRGDAIVSVQRVAYALAHPEDHVGLDENVTTTCGKRGDSTGVGACVKPEHMIKVPCIRAKRAA